MILPPAIQCQWEKFTKINIDTGSSNGLNEKSSHYFTL
jgi:hypothetical protein